MRVTRFRGEGSLKELVDRLYQIDEGGPSQTAAAASLIEANRHLPLQSHDLASAVPKGTMVAVPELEATRPGRTTKPLREAAAKAALARATTALGQLSAAWDADSDRAATELKATHALIGSKEFKEAAKRDPQVAAQLEEIGSAAQAELDRIEHRRERQRQVLERAKAASERLAGVLAGTTKADANED
jgi:hypothetical protein